MWALAYTYLWNELARDLRFSLWCAYHGNSLAVHEHAVGGVQVRHHQFGAEHGQATVHPRDFGVG